VTLSDAKLELRHPPKVGLRLMLSEAAVMLSLAFILFLIFG
jgi:hypothetical protein